MMDRRKVLGAAAAASVLAHSLARAQPAAGRFTIGMLGLGSPASSGPFYDGFYARMRELGYVEGRNVSYELRWANGQPDKLPALAAELVGRRADVIVASIDSAIAAAKRATSTIPIVTVFSTDPVGNGLIASLARPGGNVTGLSFLASTALRGKRLQVLKESVPGLSRVAVLWNSDGQPGGEKELAELATFAQALGLSLDIVEIRTVDDIDKALSTIAGKRPGALMDQGAVLTSVRRQQIADFALAQRLSSVGTSRDRAQAGYLLSLGTDSRDSYRHAATSSTRSSRAPSPPICRSNSQRSSS